MKLRIPQATKKGYIEVEPYGAFDWTYPSSLTRRGRVQGGGQIDKPYLWIDTYNQCVNSIAGTIKARIDSNCMYFVSVEE